MGLAVEEDLGAAGFDSAEADLVFGLVAGPLRRFRPCRAWDFPGTRG